MEKAQNYDVYIIYRRKDKDTARVIAQLLQSAGKSVFFDMEVLLFGDISEHISSGLELSQSYIVLLSKDCMDRCNQPNDWWTKEVDHAVQSGKKIIPVNIEDSFKLDGLKDLPEGVKSLLKIQWMPFYGSLSDSFVNEILSLLDNQVSNEYKKEDHDIFLAYPREDLKAAEKLSKAIQANGLSVWRDIDGIYTGDSFVKVITDAITSSKVFIAIYSSWALKSHYFNVELEFARKKKIPIIKVLTDTPEGLSGTRRMTFGSLLEMGSARFEEKLLSGILNNGCKPVTKEMASYGKELYNKAIRTNNLQEEGKSFCILMRAAELGDSEALSYIESRMWNIDLREAVSQYIPINSYFIEDLRADLYNRGEIIAEDSTLTDVEQRGCGMEKVAFRMMKRAIDLGFDGSDPVHYDWYYLTDKDFDECLSQLGASSGFYRSSTKPKSKQIISTYNENVSQYHDSIEKVESWSANQKKLNEGKVTADKLLKEYTPHHVDYDIFISYRRDDAREHARNVQLALRSNGFGKVFFDYDSIQDGEFTKRIINAVYSCTDFLLLLSPKSMERCVNQGDPVACEIRAAKKYGKHIIPMQLNGKEITWPKGFPIDLEFIKDIHWHDHMTNSYFDESIKKLILRLKTRKQTNDNLRKITKDAIDDTNQDKLEESFEDSVELQLAWIDYNDGNFKEALRSFLLEAKKGSANALNAIGIYYYEGKACPHNYQQAMSYFQKAANLGYASAMRNLGDCYRWGHGVRQDVEKSIYWYKKAVEKKNLKAIYLLAQCYRDISPIEADQYYLEAAHMGHEEAIKYVVSHGLAKNEDDIKWINKDSLEIDKKYNYHCRLTLKHKDAVESAIFSSDGKRIVSASDDNTLRLWRVDNGECIAKLKGHNDSVTCVSLSSDDSRLVSASDDETIRIWDVESSNCLRILNGHDDSIWSALFSPDGKFIVSASVDKTVRIWDVGTGRCVKTMLGHIGEVNYACFSPNGQHVVSASEDGTIRVWNWREGTCVYVLTEHTDAVWYVRYSPDGKFIISASADTTIRIWDAEKCICLKVLNGHGDDVNSASFSSDGAYIVSSSDDKTIRIWDVQTGECSYVIEGHTDFVNSAFFSNDGKIIVSASDDCTIKVWSFE